jgi:hypothetical protein
MPEGRRGGGSADEGGVNREPDQFERSEAGRPSDPASGSRPWLGVKFVCAGAYLRVYRNADATAYLATCPRCARCVRFRVGQGGVSQRFFEVHC